MPVVLLSCHDMIIILSSLCLLKMRILEQPIFDTRAPYNQFLYYINVGGRLDF